MKDIFIVTKFTMIEMLKRKSFLISTAIIAILIVLGFNVPNIINSLNPSDTSDTILVIDPDQVFQNQIESLNHEGLNYKFTPSDASYDDLKSELENDEIKSAIIVEKPSGSDQPQPIKLRYLVKNTALISETPQPIIDQLSSLYTNLQLQKLHLSDKQLASLNPNFEFSLEQTQTEEIGGNIFVMMVLSIVLFYAIYTCAFQVSSSITTEKTSKIMETLVTSTSPTNIVLGKTIGIGLVGLLQMVFFGIVAIISAFSFLDSDMISQVIDLSNFTPLLAFMTIIYFLLGYFVYALLFALTGSTISKPEDIQSANAPVVILVMFSFYLAYFTLTDPTSTLNIFASLFPFSSPFCLPIRLMMGLATPWETILSLLILLITIFLIARIAIKIYSNAILNYGTKMSFKELINSHKNH